MKIEVVLAIIGVLFAAVFAITVPLEYYRLSGVLLTFLGFLLWAAAVIASDKRCDPTLSALSEESYHPLYQRLMRRVVGGALWLFGQERPDDDTRTVPKLIRDTFTYRLLDRAMLFAVAYPVLLLVLFWGVTGRDGSMGDVVVFAAEPADWKRYVALGGIFLVLSSGHLVQRVRACHARALNKVADLVPYASLLFFAWVSLVLGLLDWLLVASAVVAAFAASVALPFSGAFALSSAVAVGSVSGLHLGYGFLVSLAVAVAIIGERLLTTGKNGQAALVVILLPVFSVICLVSFPTWDEISLERRSAFLFLAILPLTNALFDAVSYGVTLVLTQLGLRGWALLCAILDIIAATLLFLLLGAALVVIVAGMHQGAGVPFVDLGGLLAQAGDWRNYWWLYAMLFSTAVPTVIHLTIASFSLQALVPLSARNWICKEIREAREGDPVSGLIATLSLGTLWFLSLALPLALLSGLIWAAWMHGLESAALFYRDWLLSVAIWMEGI